MSSSSNSVSFRRNTREPEEAPEWIKLRSGEFKKPAWYEWSHEYNMYTCLLCETSKKVWCPNISHVSGGTHQGKLYWKTSEFEDAEEIEEVIVNQRFDYHDPFGARNHQGYDWNTRAGRPSAAPPPQPPGIPRNDRALPTTPPRQVQDEISDHDLPQQVRLLRETVTNLETAVENMEIQALRESVDQMKETLNELAQQMQQFMAGQGRSASSAAAA